MIRITDGTRRSPLMRVLVSFPIACFCSALATDLAYVWTMNVMWVDFSTWLLAVAMAFAVLAAVVGVVRAIIHRHDPDRPFSWPAALGVVVVLLLGFLNNLVHSRDAWTAVMPEGLALSAAVVVVMLLTNWLAMPRRGTSRLSDPLMPAGARR